MENEKVIEDIKSCPIYKTIELFQGKWTVWILYELSKNGTMRFNALKKAIPGISNTMLTSTLKDLEEKSLIKRIQYNEIPPHVEYISTTKAKNLKIVFEAMEQWGSKNL